MGQEEGQEQEGRGGAVEGTITTNALPIIPTVCRTTHSKCYNKFGADLVPFTVLTALTKDTISVSRACCILVVPFSSQLDTECTSLEWEREERRKK